MCSRSLGVRLKPRRRRRVEIYLFDSYTVIVLFLSSRKSVKMCALLLPQTLVLRLP